MKPKIIPVFLLVSCMLTSVSVLDAQELNQVTDAATNDKVAVVNDPLMNVYKVGGSSEIYMAFTDAAKTITRQGIIDIHPDMGTGAVTSTGTVESGFVDVRKNAAAAGDFNGNGADEIVSIQMDSQGKISVVIPLINKNLAVTGQKEYVLDGLTEGDFERIRICTGNFDGDPQIEFAIAYGKSGGKLTIMLFETDSDLNIKLLGSYKEIDCFDWNFDITAGDTNGDGRDEIIVVKNNAIPTAGKQHPENGVAAKFTTNYDLYTLEYDTPAKPKELSLTKAEKEIKLLNVASGNYHFTTIRINEMRIACGDLNADGKEDVVVGWSGYYCNYNKKVNWYDTRWTHKYCDVVFVHTFMSGNSESPGAYFVTSNDSYGEKKGTANQHIALSLKCEQLDNIAGDEILVNGSVKFCVWGLATDGLMEEKLALDLPGSLNILGNESFILADLNPDTVNLNFNKEIIILKSNRSPQDQLNSNSPVTQFDIYTVDATDPKQIKLIQQNGSSYNLPFENTTSIKITSFVAGDFDLNDAEVFFVGAPDIFHVNDLVEPLVILNSPPVHFDRLNGEIHDLSNVFTDGNTSFSATYSYGTSEEVATSFEVNNAFSFSAEFNAYAMYGGTGLEASVKKSWEKGNSYFSANSRRRSIGESITSSMEDIVFASILNYDYYRYPVYNGQHKKVGQIAVLSPTSEITLKGTAGKYWEHPAYIFNHEIGNILSYKPYKNETDFYKGDSDIKSDEFATLNVTNNTFREFQFLINNISETGTSVSFKSGTGRNLFMKAGYEATNTAGVSIKLIEVSKSTDIRVGVSAELSTNFSHSTLQTQNISLQNSFKIAGTIGGLLKKYEDKAHYAIIPYVYRSQSGALVLDYMVKLDPVKMYWWKDHYGQHPDLAFILPWRFAPEKGGEEIRISTMQKTSDIQFFKPIASPGDTVCIVTRVSNFSLRKFNDILKVDYYLGDPKNGGTKLTDIYGQDGISDYTTLEYGKVGEDEVYLTFHWKVPENITCSPRIYAVIDPENDIPEIHKNNNIGWNRLPIFECDECNYSEPLFTNTKNSWLSTFEPEIFPNPVSSSAMIRFFLPRSENVTIELFTLAGVKVATVTDRMYFPGEQEVRCDPGELTGGIYLCRISAGSQRKTIKMVLLR